VFHGASPMLLEDALPLFGADAAARGAACSLRRCYPDAADFSASATRHA
jgi:hypothetical protein